MTLPVAVSVPGPVESRLVAAWEPLRRELVVVRRCADVADVLAVCGAGLVRAVVLGADLPGCDSDTVDALRRARVGVLVLLPAGPGGEQHERRWRALGVTRFASEERPPVDLAREVALTVGDEVEEPAQDRPGTAEAQTWPGTGRVVAVWGPHGSTGRTTLATNLAAELADTGQRVLLVDADTRGASVAQLLGLLDEAPSLLAAVRAAADGRLDAAALTRRATRVDANLSVLSGSADPSRWGEVRPAALRRLLELAGAGHDWTVVDLPGGCDDLAAESGRDALLATVLEAADLVVVVGSADPVGLQRLVRAWGRLPELAPDAVVLPVVNRVRVSAVGSSPVRRITALLRRSAGIEDVVTVPHDEVADSALLAGRTLVEHAGRSVLRRTLRDLAARLETLVDAPLPAEHGDLISGFDPLLARS
ncbi:AAA family ATPase [Kineococcus rhizosphaerae]|uniref:MinD-like ATPase involved in chromosome partitioning or flagellar assembly n=1 Tax=Kineococcus rhizosphaerae TaxID=559628 RepID=A0A2T0QZX7_9ACTN|nr:P-loop NTPase [Kineococcus rhizosphaerae]PRY12442.1 MinD-like ATPase involved in chromosome partitioning or flagellar assembly [Kineococcus rhizosphaerae]